MPNRKAARTSALKSLRPKASPSREIVAQALNKARELEAEMAAVLREMREKVGQLETLNEFSGAINASLDPAVVGEKAIEATCRLVSCERASLFLVDGEGRGDLLLPGGKRVPIDDRSISGHVAMTGESLTLNDVRTDSRHLVDDEKAVEGRGPGASAPIHAVICVPLRAKDRVIGVLKAINKLPSAPRRPSRHAWPDFHESDRRLLETLSHQVAVALENARLYAEIKKSFFDTVEALAEAIEKKDHYTGGHTKRVVHYTMVIARNLELTEDELERIRLGAILHDVGKIGIEDKILKKDAPLTAEEWEVMRRHPALGYDILRRVEGLRDVIGAMRSHHERWDGKGYPLGLKGEEIPLLARIISVADTYDAMVSTRPYRKGMPPQSAYDEIVKHRGSQFDPMVVEAFERAFKEGKMGRGSGPAGEGQLANCD